MRARGEAGAALVVALWSSAILALIAAGVIRLARDDAALTRSLIERTEAELAADAGVAAALHGLLAGPASWPAEDAAETIEFAGVEVRIVVSDEAQRLDLNRADAAALTALLREAGEGEAAARAFAAAVLARRGGAAAEQAGEEEDASAAEERAAFARVEMLRDVPGIGPDLYAELEDRVTVHGGRADLPRTDAQAGAARDEDEEDEAGDAPEETGQGLFRIRAEARTRRGAVAVRVGVFAIGRAPGPGRETRLWIRDRPRLFAEAD